MANYTKLKKGQLVKMIKKYKLKTFLNFESMPGGFANTSFLIKTKQQLYVLTLLEESSFKQAKRYTKLMRWLNKHEYRTSAICTTLKGKIVSKFKGKPVILKKWIPGNVIHFLKIKQIKEVGKYLAKLHQIPPTDDIPIHHAYGVETFQDVIGKQIDKKYEAWLGKRQVEIKRNLSKDLPKGLIHGDLFYDNILFKKKQFKAIIDFESACFYYLIFDLGMTVLGICQKDNKIDLKKVRALIKGYEKVRKLSPIEKEYFQFFIAYAATATSKWRYWKSKIDKPHIPLERKYQDMVRLSKKVNDMDPKYFLKSVFK